MLSLTLRYQEQIRYFPMPDRDVRLGAAMENDLVAPFPVRGIDVEVLQTGDAVRRYTELDERRTAAALHLTC